jgi:hypothetical protein
MCGLFNTSELTKKTVIQCYSWCIAVFLFYGITLGADNLGGNFYVSFALVNIIEIPSNFLLESMILGSLLYLILNFVPMVSVYRIVRVALGTLSKGCVNVSLHGLYIWSMELYTTELRSSALGLFSGVGRVGVIVSPWLTKGLNTDSGAIIKFIVMGALGISAGLFMFLLAETKNKEIDEIDVGNRDTDEDEVKK